MTSPAQNRRRRARTAAVVAAAVLIPAGAAVAGLLPASAAASPTATFAKNSDWGTGWQGTYTIRNTGDSVLSSWTVELDLPAGTTVTTHWNAVRETSGQHYTFKNETWNGAVAPGASVTFGFLGSGPGAPAGCRINGVPCAGGGNPAPPTTRPTTSPPATTGPTTPPPGKPPVTTSPPVKPPVTTAPPAGRKNLDDPAKKDIAMQIVSTAENSSLDWRAQFSYIEDIRDGRGYTAGIIGFCSGTFDMLQLIENYTAKSPGNPLARYIPAIRRLPRPDSHEGLDGIEDAWRRAATDPVFRAQQEIERDNEYFNPAVDLAKRDGLRALGQFAYYDAAVMHGFEGLRSIRAAALRGDDRPPAQGGVEKDWLEKFLDARVVEMKKEAAHQDVSRVETAQREWLRKGNLDLDTPLAWLMYKEPFRID